MKRKACGCKTIIKCGIPVENLCKKHMEQVIAEANKAYERRGQPKIGDANQ